MENHRVQEMMQLMASKIRAIASSISDTDIDAFLTEDLECTAYLRDGCR